MCQILINAKALHISQWSAAFYESCLRRRKTNEVVRLKFELSRLPGSISGWFDARKQDAQLTYVQTGIKDTPNVGLEPTTLGLRVPCSTD